MSHTAARPRSSDPQHRLTGLVLTERAVVSLWLLLGMVCFVAATVVLLAARA